MANVQQNKGRCYICRKEFGKTAMKNHLLKCNDLSEGNTGYFLIGVEGAYSKDYWLYLQVEETATLDELDDFLRDIWLECCGHLSSFTINNVTYDKAEEASNFIFGGEHKKMSKCKLKEILKKGMSFKHEYDFGSTTELKLTVVEVYTGKNSGESISLLARNNKIKYKCKECGADAEFIYADMDEVEYPPLCEACAEDVDEEAYLIKITNSPRMGVCGYDGDSDVYELED